ncbi:tRNA (adenine(37)-N6)-methyltransferase-like isoform X2 [Stegodyphus dumicola]|uniref:tRNA (adenine(37)-N6)-methyltransferase-like isoform X2 n=1 Tax=Stegodyphus dumicola TaxID=202533 RepID=UPI0015A896CB|nr:tRNA (adenine(37)-N6)-methyltransferase-like isoform X2 [Stegodyphus dumicola]
MAVTKVNSKWVFIQELMKQNARLKSEVSRIKTVLSQEHLKSGSSGVKGEEQKGFSMVPIGHISSCFNTKNGIPRQPSLCSAAKATLKIENSIFTNPEHSLIGLDEFSHIWVLFVFHENKKQNSVKAKVHPPRLNGASVGVFSTRSPHRPCAIGLSLVKLDKIEGSILFLSGIDILDKTPVLDIKPYIPFYDIPNALKISSENELSEKHQSESGSSSQFSYNCKTKLLPNQNAKSEFFELESFTNSKKFNQNLPSLSKAPEYLDVMFTNRAVSDLEMFHSEKDHSEKCRYCLTFVDGQISAKKGIIEILENDPRSVYRRQKCTDRLYYFYLDNMHITCWFDEMIAEVLRVKPSCKV